MPLLVAVLAVVVLGLAVAGWRLEQAIGSAQGQTAADAAALGGAIGGVADAQRLAEANAARLLDHSTVGGVFVARVGIDGLRSGRPVGVAAAQAVATSPTTLSVEMIEELRRSSERGELVVLGLESGSVVVPSWTALVLAGDGWTCRIIGPDTERCSPG